MRKFALLILFLSFAWIKMSYELAQLSATVDFPLTVSSGGIILAVVEMGVLMFVCQYRGELAHTRPMGATMMTLLIGMISLTATEALLHLALTGMNGPGSRIVQSIQGTLGSLGYHFQVYAIMVLPIALFGHKMWPSERKVRYAPSGMKVIS